MSEKETTVKVTVNRIDDMIEGVAMATEMGANIIIDNKEEKIIVLQALVMVRDGLVKLDSKRNGFMKEMNEHIENRRYKDEARARLKKLGLLN